MADFFSSLIKTVASFSFQVNPDCSVTFPEEFGVHPYEGKFPLNSRQFAFYFFSICLDFLGCLKFCFIFILKYFFLVQRLSFQLLIFFLSILQFIFINKQKGRQTQASLKHIFTLNRKFGAQNKDWSKEYEVNKKNYVIVLS